MNPTKCDCVLGWLDVLWPLNSPKEIIRRSSPDRQKAFLRIAHDGKLPDIVSNYVDGEAHTACPVCGQPLSEIFQLRSDLDDVLGVCDRFEILKQLENRYERLCRIVLKDSSILIMRSWANVTYDLSLVMGSVGRLHDAYATANLALFFLRGLANSKKGNAFFLSRLRKCREYVNDLKGVLS